MEFAMIEGVEDLIIIGPSRRAGVVIKIIEERLIVFEFLTRYNWDPVLLAKAMKPVVITSLADGR